jgi:hypothetical protein
VGAVSRRKHQRLTDPEFRLLSRIEAGETVFRGSSVMRADETIEILVDLLISLRERALIALADSRIMRNQAGQVLGAGPCNLTSAGRQALEWDRGLGPRFMS